MTHIHDKEVNKQPNAINPPKRAKKLDIHYSPILRGCINTRKGRVKFKNFRTLLGSGCSYTILMRRLFEKLHIEQYAVMQWHTQDGNITTNLRVKVDSTLPTLSATHVVMWNCHVDEFSKGRYDMILGQYLLT